jgi:hypothetical protein
MAGVLAKSASVALTAAAVVRGAVLVPLQRHVSSGRRAAHTPPRAGGASLLVLTPMPDPQPGGAGAATSGSRLLASTGTVRELGGSGARNGSLARHHLAASLPGTRSRALGFALATPSADSTDSGNAAEALGSDRASSQQISDTNLSSAHLGESGDRASPSTQGSASVEGSAPEVESRPESSEGVSSPAASGSLDGAGTGTSPTSDEAAPASSGADRPTGG